MAAVSPSAAPHNNHPCIVDSKHLTQQNLNSVTPSAADFIRGSEHPNFIQDDKSFQIPWSPSLLNETVPETMETYQYNSTTTAVDTAQEQSTHDTDIHEIIFGDGYSQPDTRASTCLRSSQSRTPIEIQDILDITPLGNPAPRQQHDDCTSQRRDSQYCLPMGPMVDRPLSKNNSITMYSTEEQPLPWEENNPPFSVADHAPAFTSNNSTDNFNMNENGSQHNNNEQSDQINFSNGSMLTNFGNHPYHHPHDVPSTPSTATTTTTWSSSSSSSSSSCWYPSQQQQQTQIHEPNDHHQQQQQQQTEEGFSLDFLAPPPGLEPKSEATPLNHHQETVNNHYHQPMTTAPANHLASDQGFNDQAEQEAEQDLKANLFPSVIFKQVATVADNLRSQILSYLLSPDPSALGELTAVILTGKVAQKSYGSEKRFLCPPPTVILDGAAWWRKGNNGIFGPPELTVCISGESQPGQLDWFSDCGTMIGQTGFSVYSGRAVVKSSVDKNHGDDRDWYDSHQQERLAGGKCVLRQLYISDTDEKRKRVECLVRIKLANGTLVGTLASEGIKVISKPSKKRQSIKNTEDCIYHGTTVSLFNRIRSQTVSTKYLGVSSCSSSSSTSRFVYPGQSKKMNRQEGTTTRDSSADGTCFIARAGSWDPFIIWLVDTAWTPPDNRENESTADDYIGCSALRNDIPYPPPPAIALKNETNEPLAIHYNQHIVLQCLTTGLVSPVMIIRKVERASTVVGGANSAWVGDGNGGGGEFGDEVLGGPVSQLHKVALQIVQDPLHRSAMQQEAAAVLLCLPRTSRPATYLACLNDLVAVHKSTSVRKPLSSDSQVLGKRDRSACQEQVYSFYMRQEEQPSKVADLGMFWSEEVTDASVWTIIGTDCAKYTLWESPTAQKEQRPPCPIPSLSRYAKKNKDILEIHGDNFTRDLEVWFGDVRSPRSECRNRQLIVCQVPPLAAAQGAEWNSRIGSYQVPLLLVKRDGSAVYKTNKHYVQGPIY